MDGDPRLGMSRDLLVRLLHKRITGQEEQIADLKRRLAHCRCGAQPREPWWRRALEWIGRNQVSDH